MFLYLHKIAETEKNTLVQPLQDERPVYVPALFALSSCKSVYLLVFWTFTSQATGRCATQLELFISDSLIFIIIIYLS